MTTPGIGHNSAGQDSNVADSPAAKDRLKSIVDRIERLELERLALASDIRDIYKEAKSNGFDLRALRETIRSRRGNQTDYENFRLLLDFYRATLD